ncbi:MAG: DUF4381 family protein [Rhodothermales bacterium]
MPASAQTVRLHVLADSVTIGERFGVAVAVEHAAGVQVVFPEPPGATAAVENPLRAGEAELATARRLPPAERGSVRVDSVVFEAATFALDSARVGPVTVQIVRGGDTTTVASPIAFVGVRSLVPAENPEPKGLAPLADFPRAWGPWLLAALAVVALLAALWWWRERRRNRPVPTSVLAPDDEVRHRLDALAAALPTSAATVKPFYVELSDALRTYLARTLGVPAREQTTRELLATLARREDAPADALDPLDFVLRLADLAKFASVQPGAAAHETALARAREAVAALGAARAPEPEPATAPTP